MRPVAPLVGAWIEIVNEEIQILSTLVAPLVGAWIEIDFDFAETEEDDVAPLVGAWIEMPDPGRDILPFRSLPLWERGLK